jgi:ribosomal protein S18 acetylase RimI-like enzyme
MPVPYWNRRILRVLEYLSANVTARRRIMIRLIEELSFNAWPSLQTVYYDGWVLRFANGFSKRANSVNPLYDSTIDPDRKIEYSEAVYREKGLKTIFKLNEISCPSNLDEILAGRGYETIDHVSVQVSELNDASSRSPRSCDIHERATDAWMDAYCGMDKRASENRETFESMLDTIVPRKAFFTLRDGEKIVASGMGVLDSGFMGLFNIIVEMDYRGGGWGSRLLSDMLGWAGKNGAHSAYLQVLKDNSSATGIYRKFGFREVSEYWYRIKD